MTPKQFQKYLDRDQACPHCGETEAVAPNHRLNRGMGGSKERDVPSNIVVLCSRLNGLIESNATQRTLAIFYGWKLTAGQDPLKTPIFISGKWWLLDNNFGKTPYQMSDDLLESEYK